MPKHLSGIFFTIIGQCFDEPALDEATVNRHSRYREACYLNTTNPNTSI